MKNDQQARNDIRDNAPSPRTANIIIGNMLVEAMYDEEPLNVPSKDEWFKNIGVDFSLEEMNYLRTHLTWGTLGVDGKGPYKFIPYEDLTVEHIKNILIVMDLNPVVKTVLLDVLVNKVASNIR